LRCVLRFPDCFMHASRSSLNLGSFHSFSDFPLFPNTKKYLITICYPIFSLSVNKCLDKCHGDFYKRTLTGRSWRMPTRNRLFENLISKKFFARKEVLRSRRLKPMQSYPFFDPRSCVSVFRIPGAIFMSGAQPKPCK